MKLRTFSEYVEDVKNFLDPTWHDKDAKNSFAFNIILGVAIILVFCVALKDTRPKQDLINWNFDNYTLWRLDAEPDDWFDKYFLFQKAADTETRRIAQDLFFLDFTDDTIKAFKRPHLLPRDKVADLIGTAYEGGASIIIVDFVFSEEDYSQKRNFAGDKKALDGQERDKILRDMLKKVRDDPDSNTKVLLMRSNGANNIEQDNIFADLVDGKKIFEVTPNHTEFRSTTRFWLPYIKVTNDDTKKTRILWSVPIMTLVLTYGNLNELRALEQQILNDSDNTMNRYSLKINRGGVIEDFPIFEEMGEAGSVERNTGAGQYNRIQYVLFPADMKKSKPFGNINDANQNHWTGDGIDVDRFKCKDKIVLIGRTDKDCEDFHFSPVGMMPGMYVHANTIATVLSSSRPHLCSMTMHLLLEFLLVLAAAYIFLNFSGSKVGYSILFMFGACWVLPFFYYCFTNEYIFLNMAFMSLGFYNVSRVVENISWQSVTELPKIISMQERK